MAKDIAAMEDSNRSANPSIHDISIRREGGPARRPRRGLRALAGAARRRAGLAGCAHAGGESGAGAAAPRIGFASVPASAADRVTVPEGYTATPFMPWGEPIGIAGAMPAFRDDAGNTAAEQALQMGMHHDGVHYFALDGSRRGLLVMNHEYADDGCFHSAAWRTGTSRKCERARRRTASR
jgi:secreted PhoX family phosphatase